MGRDRMLSPVRCNHCQQVYDLADGKPVARYADCTVYITPCCNRQVDDRPAGWTGTPAFTKMTRAEAERGEQFTVLPDGRMMVHR